MAWLMAAVPVVFALVVLLLAIRPLSDRALNLWANRYSLVLLEPGPHELARNHLRIERTARSTGAAIGIVLGGLPLYLSALNNDAAVNFSNAMWGGAWIPLASLGALAGNLFILRTTKSSGIASLTERRPGRFLDMRFLKLMRLGTILAAAITTVALILGWGSRRFLAFGFLECLLGVFTLTYGLQLIVHRPAQNDSAIYRFVDNALRASDAHQLAGVTIALCASGFALVLKEATTHFTRWGWLAVNLEWLGIFAWWTLARDATWAGLFDSSEP